MDKSKEYQKMCIGAWPDITTVYNPLFSRRRRMLYTDGEDCYRWDEIVNPSNYSEWYPLYEQDQLQEMANSKFTTWQQVQKFWNWLWTKEPVTTGLSMEQLWLAYVMSELFDKAWSGTEWVVKG